MVTVESEALLYSGTELCRQRKYTAAIAELTKALEYQDIPLFLQIDTLDNRAAARGMIGGTVNLDLALQDARMMIQLSKVNATGYFRAGKIFELLNQDKAALNIYKDGIEQVDPGSSEFERLKKLLKEVQDRISSREVRDTRRDPLNLLPTELAESILQYLPFHELMIVQRVSTMWRSFIHASRRTYTFLDLSAAKRAVSDSTLQAYISRSRGNVREAVLSRSSRKSTLSILVHQCRQLSILTACDSQICPYEFIELWREPNIPPNLAILITDLRFSMDNFRGILESSTSLREFECKGIAWGTPAEAFTANLRRLKIGDNAFTSALDHFPGGLLRDLVKCLPRLEDIEIGGPSFSCAADFSSLQSLSVLALCLSRTRVFPRLPESIRVLDISGNPSIQWSLKDLKTSPLPNLESLKADNNPEIENAHVLAILAPSLGKRSLRSLSLHACPKLNFSSLEWLAQHGENLEELAVGGNTISGEATKDVAKFKKLKYLDLAFSRISYTGLMNVVIGSPGVLKEVCMTRCMGVGVEATIGQLAAESGVELTRRRWGQ